MSSYCSESHHQYLLSGHRAVNERKKKRKMKNVSLGAGLINKERWLLKHHVEASLADDTVNIVCVIKTAN